MRSNRASRSSGNEYRDDVDRDIDEDRFELEERGEWYRLPEDGMIAGICAGMADYYEVSTLMARGIAVTGALFIPQIIVIAYIVGVFCMPTRRELLNGETKNYGRRARKKAEKLRARARRAKRKQRRYEAQHFTGEDGMRRSSSRRAARKARRRQGNAGSYGSQYEPQAAHASQSVDSKRVMLRKYNEKFKNMDTRMRDLEKHVTSRQYDLAREIDSL